MGVVSQKEPSIESCIDPPLDSQHILLNAHYIFHHVSICYDTCMIANVHSLIVHIILTHNS